MSYPLDSNISRYIQSSMCNDQIGHETNDKPAFSPGSKSYNCFEHDSCL